MGRGGNRKHPADCKCGKCPQIGRKKTERLANPKLADKILHDVRAYELELACIALEVKKLGIDLDDKDWLKKIPVKELHHPDSLFKMLDRLKCHARGNPCDTVNHLHDKPMEIHHTFTISERIKRARERVAAQLK
jgi:hypothetical protein